MALCKECGLEWTPMHHSEDEYMGEEYGCLFAKMNHGTPQPHPVREVQEDNYYLAKRGFTINSLTTNGNVVFSNGEIKSNAG